MTLHAVTTGCSSIIVKVTLIALLGAVLLEYIHPLNLTVAKWLMKMHSGLDSLMTNGKADPPQTVCSNGTFLLSGMTRCHPWLNCNDIETQITVENHAIGFGAVKKVFKGTYKGAPVAVSHLTHQDMLEDFKHGLEMLKLYNGNKFNRVVQLVGWCLGDQPVVITEFHPLGTADNAFSHLQSKYDTEDIYLRVMFQMCISFLEILHMLHTYNGETRVMCDANDPVKCLSQILVTSKLELLLNDVDSLALVDKNLGTLIKCGHKELGGDYVAPEQLWPFEDIDFVDDLMPGYDEKVDIWKVPAVVNRLLEGVKGGRSLQLHLFDIHAKCKAENPKDRPTASEILQVYNKVKESLKL